MLNDTSDEESSEAIAIIGMSCRVPGARNVDEFWQNLSQGVESIRQFSEAELVAAGYHPSILNQPNYVNARGVIPDIELFDAGFFRFSPREAEILDPQQRVFLECAWEALESAGYDPDSYPGLVGVFGGSGMSRYMFNLMANPQIVSLMGMYQIGLANDKDHITTRAAYKLNLRGPAFTIQCACSTSLVAVCTACQSLLDFHCDMALAGGCTIDLPQNVGYYYQEGGISSPDGHCRAFDAEAQGTVGGNGAGVVLLKRLSDALAEGDTIHAVILGSAINNDGSVKVGYTAPSIAGQAAVIGMAQAIAGVEPDTITYVEAHGTGTTLGDPIEISALTQAFRAKTSRKNFCAIGSVKTNIGHLDTAAGVVGLIKTVLSLTHRQIPPSLHFRHPNPNIDFAKTPFYVNTSLATWRPARGPRRAGVSSFGMGGTNAHVILEEAPQQVSEASQRPYQLVTLSGPTATALEKLTANLAAHLRDHPDLNLADVAYTLNTGRRTFEHRRVLVCRDVDDAAAALATLPADRVLTGMPEKQAGGVAFLFPGQGAQYPNMARDLYEAEPVFRQEVDHCSDFLIPLLGLDLRDLLFPLPGAEAEAERRLRQTAITQPALFVVEYALAQLWISWGIRPVAMIGHSSGEYTAACLAGVFSLEHALAIVAERGRLMQALPPGAMLAVAMHEDRLRSYTDGDTSLAAVNTTSECVVSGETAAIERLEARFSVDGAAYQRLRTSHAFHSAMMDPILDPFRDTLRAVKFSLPRIPFVSNLSGTWITAEEATDPEYWTRHLRHTVRFADGIGQLLREPSWVLLEVGPGRTLVSLAAQHPDRDKRQAALSSLRHSREGHSDSMFLLNTLGRLWLAGIKVDWPAFYAHEQRLRIPLPTYPFERRRYWIEAPPPGASVAQVDLRKSDLADWFYVRTWRQVPLSGTATSTPEGTRWLVLCDDLGLGSVLVQRLRSQHQEVTTVATGPEYARFDDETYAIDPRSREDYTRILRDLGAAGRFPKQVLHLWSLTPDEPPAQQESAPGDVLDLGFYSLNYLAQAIGDVVTNVPLRIGVVTNHVHAATGKERTEPLKATLLGPCKIIPQEYPFIQVRSVELETLPAAAPGLAELADQLMEEFASHVQEPAVIYRESSRWVEVYEPVRLPKPTPASQNRLRDRGVYMITGGLGGIGLVVAEYLARTVKARLVLVGRTPLPERAEWENWLAGHDPTDHVAERIRKVQELEGAGAEVLIANADVADRVQMQAVLDAVHERFGTLHGVVHSAGVAGGGIIQLKTRKEAERVLAPKVAGTLILDDLLADAPLDFFVLCSSLAAVFGGAGQVDYCAANAFLDAFAWASAAAGKRPTVSINWEQWLEVGMAVNTDAPAEMRRARETGPLQGIRPREGAEAFERILTSTFPQVVVATADFRPLLAAALAPGQPEMAPVDAAASSQAPLHERPSLSNTYVAPQSDAERAIAAIFEALLGVQPVGTLDSFFELGGHSLLAIQVISRIHETFDVKLPMRTLFDAPAVADLAAAIELVRHSASSATIDEAAAGQEFEEGEI